MSKKQKAEEYNSPIMDEIIGAIPTYKIKQVEISMKIACLIDDVMKENNFKTWDLCNMFGVEEKEIKLWLSGGYNFDINLLCNIEERLGIKVINLDDVSIGIRKTNFII
jgi:hypothetical protein